ncbi:hypothetical protein Tco_0304992 [Tanacetum coccineum]
MSMFDEYIKKIHLPEPLVLLESNISYQFVRRDTETYLLSGIEYGCAWYGNAAQGFMRLLWLIENRNDATYSASAEDIVVQSCFFDIQLTYLSPRNYIPLEVLLRVSRHLA